MVLLGGIYSCNFTVMPLNEVNSARINEYNISPD